MVCAEQAKEFGSLITEEINWSNEADIDVEVCYGEIQCACHNQFFSFWCFQKLK